MRKFPTGLKTGTVRLVAIGLIATGALWAFPSSQLNPGTTAPPANQQPAAATSENRDAARLYHVPIAVSDLDAATRLFRRMGFTIKAGVYHSDGIRNVHAKFSDGTEIELITAPKQPKSSTAKSYRALIDQADGPAYLALYVRNLEQVSQQLTQVGQQHNLSARYLIPTDTGPLPYVFYAPGGKDAVLNRSPTDRPEHYKHANGAQRLSAVWLASDDFGPLQNLLGSLGATLKAEDAVDPVKSKAMVATLKSGRVIMYPARDQMLPGRVLIGLTVDVGDLNQIRRILVSNKIMHQELIGKTYRSLIVHPSAAGGTWLEYRADVR